MPSAQGAATPPLLLNPEQPYDRYSSDAELRFAQLRIEFGFQSIAAFSFFLICVTLNREHRGSWWQDMSGRWSRSREEQHKYSQSKRRGAVAGTEARLGFYCRAKVNWLGGSFVNSHLLPLNPRWPCAYTWDHAGPVGKCVGHSHTTILRSCLQSGCLTLPMKSYLGFPIFHKNVWVLYLCLHMAYITHPHLLLGTCSSLKFWAIIRRNLETNACARHSPSTS